MADKKISQLTAASTPLAGTEVLPIVQNGTTVKVANNDLRPLQIQSNTSSGVLQVTGPAAGTTRVATIPDANFTVARTDAGQTFTGNQSITGTLATTGNLGAGIASPTVRGHFATDNAETKIYAQRTQSAISAGDILGSLSFVGTDSSSGASGERVKLEAKSAGVFGQTDFNLYASNTNAATLRYKISGIDGANYWYGIDGTTLRMSLDSNGNQTLATGNLIQGTAAKGINFTANTPAAGMTSQLLNWYEEGTWTPNQGDGLTLVGAFSSSGTYTRIGRQVFIRGSVSGATSVAVASAGNISTNLPYSSAADTTGTAINAANNASSILRVSSATLTAATAIVATTTITFSAVYSV